MQVVLQNLSATAAFEDEQKLIAKINKLVLDTEVGRKSPPFPTTFTFELYGQNKSGYFSVWCPKATFMESVEQMGESSSSSSSVEPPIKNQSSSSSLSVEPPKKNQKLSKE